MVRSCPAVIRRSTVRGDTPRRRAASAFVTVTTLESGIAWSPRLSQGVRLCIPAVSGHRRAKYHTPAIRNAAKTAAFYAGCAASSTAWPWPRLPVRHPPGTGLSLPTCELRTDRIPDGLVPRQDNQSSQVRRLAFPIQLPYGYDSGQKFRIPVG